MIRSYITRQILTLSEYNQSLYNRDGILTGKEYRRLRRKTHKKG